jgi:hypothetical protein
MTFNRGRHRLTTCGNSAAMCARSEAAMARDPSDAEGDATGHAGRSPDISLRTSNTTPSRANTNVKPRP